jgi:hypothetical protein
MALWRLVPVDLGDPSWLASSHRQSALVRAPTEEAAREAAERAFGVKTRFPPGRGVAVSPWKRPWLVAVELIHDDRHAAEGPTEVLEPSFELRP